MYKRARDLVGFLAAALTCFVLVLNPGGVLDFLTDTWPSTEIWFPRVGVLVMMVCTILYVCHLILSLISRVRSKLDSDVTKAYDAVMRRFAQIRLILNRARPLSEEDIVRLNVIVDRLVNDGVLHQRTNEIRPERFRAYITDVACTVEQFGLGYAQENSAHLVSQYL